MDTLLLTIDALRADHIGCYGYARDTTPFLDDFAGSNARFRNAFANGTYTLAAFPPIFTGSLRKESSDPYTVGNNLEIRAPTVASRLQDSGVRTVGINTNSLFEARYERFDGFDQMDYVVPEEKENEDRDTEVLTQPLWRRVASRAADAAGVKARARRLYDRFRTVEDIRTAAYVDAGVVTDRTLTYLRESNQGEDIFVWAHYMDPHEPYGYLHSLYPASFLDETLFEEYSSAEVEEISRRARRGTELLSPDESDLLVDLYDAYVRFVDAEIGRLLATLRTMGQFEDTQVIVTADHGEEFGEHGQYYHGNKPYDELIRVPLLVKSPAVDAGVYERQVSHIDIAPTIVDGYGGDTSEFDGLSLGDSPPAQRPVIATSATRPYFDLSPRPVAAIRYPDWKLIYHLEEPDELYHLVADATETENVRDQHPKKHEELKSELHSYLNFSETERTVDEESFDEHENEAMRNRLEHLGYTE